MPITNDGRLIPTKATTSVTKSAAEPGWIPPTTPAVKPIAQAISIARSPRVSDTGNPAARISLTVQSWWVRLGPKSKGRSWAPSRKLTPVALPR